jgi:hypothetical protein
MAVDWDSPDWGHGNVHVAEAGPRSVKHEDDGGDS